MTMISLLHVPSFTPQQACSLSCQQASLPFATFFLQSVVASAQDATNFLLRDLLLTAHVVRLRNEILWFRDFTLASHYGSRGFISPSV